MTRRRPRSRRKVALTVGVAAALMFGGVVAAPFASADVAPGSGGTSVQERGGGLQRIIDFWSNRRGDGGGGLAGGGLSGGGGLAGGGLGGGLSGGGLGGAAAGGNDASADGDCPDVQMIFARGTGDFPQPLGIIGTPLGQQLTKALSGKEVQVTGVNYAADFAQTSDGPGATEMTRLLTETAANCEDTQFVIGGYSQGGSVTDIAVAATGSQVLGRGESIPTDLAPRVKAVLVFGNPLSGFGGGTLEQASDLYGAKTKSFCGTSDPVCGGTRSGVGNVTGGHLSYPANGAIAQAATFAAGKIE